MKETLAVITNRVDVSRMEETVNAVKNSPDAGSFHFRIQNRWVNGGENLSEVRPFTAGGKLVRHKNKMVLSADEPEVLLGNDTGANLSSICFTPSRPASQLPWFITQPLAAFPSIRLNLFSKAISTSADFSASIPAFAMAIRAFA